MRQVDRSPANAGQKTKDNVEGQSKEELDSQKEVSDKSEPADKPYITFEQIKSLEDVIGRLHAEADFAAKAFGGNTQEAIRSLKCSGLLSK